MEYQFFIFGAFLECVVIMQPKMKEEVKNKKIEKKNK